MSYTLRVCKECRQYLHIRKKGRLLNIKNRCIHFNELTITRDQLEKQVIPLSNIILSAKRPQDFPQTCIIHKVPMNFVQYLQRFTELYYCPKCATLDKLLPTKHINWWKKKSWNKNWRPGDVKLIVSPNYETMKKQESEKSDSKLYNR